MWYALVQADGTMVYVCITYLCLILGHALEFYTVCSGLSVQIHTWGYYGILFPI